MKYLRVFLVLFLVSCATPVKQQKEALSLKSICCNSIDEFYYPTVNLTQGVTLELDNSSQVYDFGEGKTYFSAFELPSDIGTPYISVESHFNGGFIGQYFEPIFLVFDENHDGLDAFSLRLRFLDANLFTNTDAHMAGHFKLPERAKYVIIFTGQFEKEAPVAQLAPSTSMVMIGNTPSVYTNQGQSINLERSPTGLIKLKLVEMK